MCLCVILVPSLYQGVAGFFIIVGAEQEQRSFVRGPEPKLASGCSRRECIPELEVWRCIRRATYGFACV
jgi:hypothetical protein